MKKKISLILLAVLLVLALVSLVACGEKPGPTPDPIPTSFTVTIDLQNGTEPTTQIVEANGTVNLPAMDDEKYREFRGWFKSADAKGLWSKNTKVTEDVTIYACWNNIAGKVTLKLNYEGAPTLDVIDMNLGNKIDFPADLARECWVLTGWYLDAEATQEFDTNGVLESKKLTLYAGWELEAGHAHVYNKVTTPATCLEGGYDTHTCKCGDSYTNNPVDATGHHFTFSDTDYFGMVVCDNDGCEVAQRKESLRIYEDDFKYTLDDAKIKEIDDKYQQMLDLLEAAARYNAEDHYYDYGSDRYHANKAFEEIYNSFYDDLIYLIEQYQYAYVFYCVDDNDANTAAYEFVSEYRTGKISDFYALYRLIHETEWREFFFAADEGWTEEDIQQALIMSDSYGDDAYVEINNRISEIEVEFRDISNPASGSEVPTLYAEFVDLNNQIAEIAGYENYIDYAYENVYSRDYSPEETKIMRNYVKTYLKDVYAVIDSGYNATSSKTFETGSDAAKYASAIMDQSIFKSKIATDLVKGYFEKMKSTTAGATEIDFYKHANDLFKNGNYYTGSYQGAFSYWIGAQDTSILYFGPGSYSGAFTFVHEFGHYYNNVYNKGIGMSYDLDEVHSQADEMMFLAYLKTALPEDVCAEIYEKIYYDNLWNMFAIVMLATAIDEFEYCVYTNTAPDGTPKEYTAADYDSLFIKIMQSYGIYRKLNDAYWRYVVIEAPCYYISYAMSALPCVELLSIANTEGFEVAQEKYFKFFTFTDDANNVEYDEVGDKVIKIGYEETLEYIGINSVFGEDLYKGLKAYFEPKAEEA